MAQTPNRLQPDTSLADNLALANDNSDKAIQDISDLGAKFSTGASGSVTITAGTMAYFIIGMQDVQGAYVKDQLPLGPRYDVSIDVNDSGHFLPDGVSVTSAMRKTVVTQRVFKTSRNNFANEKATYVIEIYNNDASDHTYYISVDAYYQQASNQGGVFR